MKKLALFTVAASAVLTLSACGKSDDASEQATPDTVEMPAEQPFNTVAAVPSPDKGEATAPADPNAGAKAEDAAANAAAAAADFNAAGGEGADQAVKDAEKKM
jgi:hypothetical protein